MNTKEAKQIAVGLSEPSKMPCWSYSIPTAHCKAGGKLREVPGSVCFHCYADLRGNYRFDNVQSSLQSRYESLNNAQWVDAMVHMIANPEKGKYPKDASYFRWHDSGDLQDERHLANIVEIARRLPTVKFWLPTKEWKLCRDYFAKQEKPSNLTVRLSMPLVDQAARHADSVFTYSEVFSKNGAPSNGAFVCRSRDQGNKCLDCRACWNNVQPTAYPEH